MKLIEIDLTKGVKSNHPDIIIGEWYLAEIQFMPNKPFYIVGKFSKVWFGLNFDCDWGSSGLQFDTPGYNSSKWKRLWKMEE